LLPHHGESERADLVVPTLSMVGYADVPGIEENENVQLIESVGSYQGVDAIPGRREYTFNGNIRVGSVGFMARAIRDASISGYEGERFRCLPMISFAGGAFYPDCDGGTDDESYLWVARQGFIQDLR